MTLEQVRNHPWLQSASFDYEATRNQMLQTLAQKQMQKQTAEPMTKPVKVKRTAPMM